MIAKYTGKLTEVPQEKVTVRFSPEVTEKFAILLAAVDELPEFSGEIHSILYDRAQGKPVGSVADAIMGVAAIAAECGRQAQAAGEAKIDTALLDLIMKIGDLDRAHGPLTLEVEKAQRQVRRE